MNQSSNPDPDPIQWATQRMLQGQYTVTPVPLPPPSPSRLGEYSGKDAELVPGTLRGYRQWELRPDGLRALNFQIRWERGRNTAKCAVSYDFVFSRYPLTERHLSPEALCTCGFYAKHRPEPYFAPGGAMVVFGSIKAYGKVILGTKGFRAQYAEIESLCLPRGMGDFWDYKVPTFPFTSDLVEAFPPIPVDGLLGPESKPEPTDQWGNWAQVSPNVRAYWIKDETVE